MPAVLTPVSYNDQLILLKFFKMIQIFNNTRKTIFCFSLLFALLLAMPAKMMAQATAPELQGTRTKNPFAAYTVESESTTYTPLVGGTVATMGTVLPGNETYLPLGFIFNMGCYDYDQFYPNALGILSFGQKGVNKNDFKIPNGMPPTSAGSTIKPEANGSAPAFLAPLWGNLSKSGGTFSYKTTGVPGSRVFTAEWKNWGLGTNVISFQVKIYEGTNIVEYIYNQEATTGRNDPFTIGIFYGVYTATAKQLWLTSSTANPTTSQTYVAPIITAPPTSGQLYRFLNNDSGLECTHFGQAVINADGGINAAATDGLRFFMSGTGQMQVRRKNVGVIAHSSLGAYDITRGTTDPYKDQVYYDQGMVLSVGNTAFAGGSIRDADLHFHADNPNKLQMVSGTRQIYIQSATNPNEYQNKIRMSATKNGLVYYLDVTYTYIHPAQKMRVDYSVVIPEGNTEDVKMLHGFQPFLQFDASQFDMFHQFAFGVKQGTAPDLVVGVKAGNIYEAFEYISGVPWSSYYSGLPSPGIYDSYKGFMTLTNYVATPPAAILDIAIAADFGSQPGTFTSSNYLVFACPAGDNKPTLLSPTAKPCKGTTFNLNDYLDPSVPLPDEGVTIIWADAAGVTIADPTEVSAGGVYWARYYSEKYDCESPAAKLTVTLDASCEVCYKPAITAGTAEPFKTIISTLDRTAVPRNWSDPRTGSLILESKEKGLVLTRIASPETAITAPVEGMIVYDTVNNVLKFYNGTVWKVLQQACPDF